MMRCNMPNKYTAAADANLVSIFAKMGDYTLERQHLDLVFKKRPTSYQSVFKCKVQFEKVAAVLQLCGMDLLANQ